MIIEAGPYARPHFFLIGFRAPEGGVGPGAQRVGVVVVRDEIRFDGSAGAPGPVLTADEPYADAGASGPFRFESEIATHKPEADVAIVDDLAQVLVPTAFGSVAVDRGAGYGAPRARNFGWLPRDSGPRLARAGRPGAAGDPSSLAGFDPAQFDLPDQYEDAFNNGQPLAGEAPFSVGDRLRFTDTTGPAVVTQLTIPAAPLLTVTRGGAPLDPPLAPVARVDTVVMDRAGATFTLVWRAAFAWQASLETATLRID